MVCIFRYNGYGWEDFNMMAWLKNYIISLVSVSVIGLILECLLAESNVKKYAMFGVSIILSISLVQPLLNIKADFSFTKKQTQQISVDYEQAIKATVNSIGGYEDAFVSVLCQNNEIIKVTIKSTSEKLLDKAVETAKQEYVKKIISAVYGVEIEKIYLSG